ncbi:hypothetical protein CN164_24475, partial [Sinorhizobium meliloti]
MTSTLHARWDFAKEIRSSALRFVAFAILIANLLLGAGLSHMSDKRSEELVIPARLFDFPADRSLVGV